MADIFGSMSAGLSKNDLDKLILSMRPEAWSLLEAGVGGLGGPSMAGIRANPQVFGSMAAGARPGPTWKDDISSIKLSRPLENMTASYRDTGDLIPRKALNPEDLLGSILTPAIGDRTIAGRALTGINDVPLDKEVLLQGGPNFMRGAQQKADQAAWASERGRITALSNRIQKLGEKGDPVNLVYSPMSARSSDYADMTTQVIREQMKTAKVTKKSKAEIDKAMRAEWGDFPAYREFPGLDKITDEWIAGAGSQRTKLAQLMDTDKFRKMGFPDMGSIRYALTEPELLSHPSGSAGMTVARTEGKAIDNPKVPHSTYNTQLQGEYLGGFEKPIPRSVMFPAWSATRKPGENSSMADRAFGMQTVAQKADQQWLDGVVNYLLQAAR